jgi:hypothetical protein
MKVLYERLLGVVKQPGYYFYDWQYYHPLVVDGGHD